MSTTCLSRLALMGLGVMAMFAAPAMAQPVLTLEGSCPGILRAAVSEAPPRHGVVLLFASETGSFRIPQSFWQHCPGVVLGLGRRNLRVVEGGTTDQAGFIAFEGMASRRACGGFLQAITSQGSCETSNVVQID